MANTDRMAPPVNSVWNNTYSETDTNWSNDMDCAQNDLGYLLNNLSEVLCDDQGNRLLLHLGEFGCFGGMNWYKII